MKKLRESLKVGGGRRRRYPSRTAIVLRHTVGRKRGLSGPRASKAPHLRPSSSSFKRLWRLLLRRKLPDPCAVTGTGVKSRAPKGLFDEPPIETIREGNWIRQSSIRFRLKSGISSNPRERSGPLPESTTIFMRRAPIPAAGATLSYIGPLISLTLVAVGQPSTKRSRVPLIR